MANVNVTPILLKGYNTASFAKPDVTAAGSSGAWNTGTITIFTVTGTVDMRVYGVVGGTTFTSTNNTGTLSLGVASGTANILPVTTIDTAARLPANSIWVFSGNANAGAALQWQAANLTWLLNNAANVILTIATNNMTAGAMTLYCDWRPISAGATVVAATP